MSLEKTGLLTDNLGGCERTESTSDYDAALSFELSGIPGQYIDDFRSKNRQSATTQSAATGEKNRQLAVEDYNEQDPETRPDIDQAGMKGGAPTRFIRGSVAVLTSPFQKLVRDEARSEARATVDPHTRMARVAAVAVTNHETAPQKQATLAHGPELERLGVFFDEKGFAGRGAAPGGIEPIRRGARRAPARIRQGRRACRGSGGGSRASRPGPGADGGSCRGPPRATRASMSGLGATVS